jgi:predicted ATP-binding protein involved in virulence
MRIHRIGLVNYRCFADRTFDLADRFNLVVGDNGMGKTSLLEGLAVAIEALIRNLPDQMAAWLDANVARVVTQWNGGYPNVEVQHPVQINVEGTVNGRRENWQRTPTAGTSFWSANSRLDLTRSEFEHLVSVNKPVVLPALGYYRTGRRWSRAAVSSVGTISPGSRFTGYLNCLNPPANGKRLRRWFKTKELLALQKKRSLPDLDAVRIAIRACIPTAEEVYWDIETDQLTVRLNRQVLAFYQLSDGYRTMLAMVADLAERCVTLNPHLGADAITQTPGCVLIDEIDLHLHPKWQRDVVNSLMGAFPLVQFVATTHSPFIIQSLPAVEGIKLLNLDAPADDDFTNKSVEDIAEQVQHVPLPQRSQRWLDMMEAAKRYYQTLEQAKAAPPEQVEALKQELDRLMLPFSDDPAYQALLLQQRTAAGIDARNGHAAG